VVSCDTPGCNNDSLPNTEDCESKEAALILIQTLLWHVSQPTEDEPKSIHTCHACMQKRAEAQRKAMGLEITEKGLEKPLEQRGGTNKMKFTIEVPEVDAGPYVKLAEKLKCTAEDLMAKVVCQHGQYAEIFKMIAPDSNNEGIESPEKEKPRGLRLLDRCPNTLRLMEETKKWIERSRGGKLIPGPERDDIF